MTCDDSVSKGGQLGLAISRDAWLAHIELDRELELHHQDDQRVLATWNDRVGFFCHRHGVLVAEASDRDAIRKLHAIASSCSSSASDSRGRRARSRRVISRARAAVFIAAAGLVLLGIGSSGLNIVQPERLLPDPSFSVLGFIALSMLTTGFAALLAGTGLALASIFPCRRQSLICIALVVCFDLLAIFLV